MFQFHVVGERSTQGKRLPVSFCTVPAWVWDGAPAGQDLGCSETNTDFEAFEINEGISFQVVQFRTVFFTFSP